MLKGNNNKNHLLNTLQVSIFCYIPVWILKVIKNKQKLCKPLTKACIGSDKRQKHLGYFAGISDL